MVFPKFRNRQSRLTMTSSSYRPIGLAILFLGMVNLLRMQGSLHQNLGIKSGLGGESYEWAVIVTVTDGFGDMFDNWYHFYSGLGMKDMKLVIVAEDEISYEKYQKRTDLVVDELVKGYTYDALGNDLPVTAQDSKISGAYSYGSTNYRALVSRRAGHLLRLLRRYPRILFTDTDTVWLADPRPYLVQDDKYDLWATIDGGTTHMCTCLLAFRATAPSFHLLQAWAKQLEKENNMNQQLFNNCWKENPGGISTKFLPKERFPTGKMYFDQNMTDGAIWVHNNWIAGYDAKVERFKKHGLWKVQE